jgi:hypothetical protein
MRTVTGAEGVALIPSAAPVVPRCRPAAGERVLVHGGVDTGRRES